MLREEMEEIYFLTQEIERRKKYNRLFEYYPDQGPLRRDLYVKHLEFFGAGLTFTERLMLAANRVGKTEGVGGYEVALHLTGLYPVWWPGKRFDRPTYGWAAGDTKETVRDIIQLKLLGSLQDVGTGLIPQHLIVNYTRKPGLADCVDTIYVRHVSGGISEIGFKSYDQGRHSFQGTKKDFIWLDEEPPIDIFIENLLRTTATSGAKDEENGHMILTFTPLRGMSETVMAFLPGGQLHQDAAELDEETQEAAKAKEESLKSKYVVMATWDDAPHLTEAVKKKLWNSIPPFQRDARSKGVPQLGAGAIFPVPESDFVVDDFPIPDHWPRAYGLDVGWNRTACVWGAFDRDTETLYLYSEHYKGQAEPVIHAQAIKARGEWIPGVIDPASRGKGQKDGEKLLEIYQENGLDLEKAFNGVEAGLLEAWNRLSAGKIKVFKSLSNWRYEFRLYRRDEKGHIVKANDHLMDATRYLVMSGSDRAITKPVDKPAETYRGGGGGWMA